MGITPVTVAEKRNVVPDNVELLNVEIPQNLKKNTSVLETVMNVTTKKGNKMSRDKQIEERRDISDIIYWSGYGFDRGTCNDISKQIQEQGYRKASDVAREIFKEVMQALEKGVAEANKTILDKTRIFTEELICTGEMYAGHIGKSICEVFKKYESEGEG